MSSKRDGGCGASSYSRNIFTQIIRLKSCLGLTTTSSFHTLIVFFIDDIGWTLSLRLSLTSAKFIFAIAMNPISTALSQFMELSATSPDPWAISWSACLSGKGECASSHLVNWCRSLSSLTCLESRSSTCCSEFEEVTPQKLSRALLTCMQSGIVKTHLANVLSVTPLPLLSSPEEIQ